VQEESDDIAKARAGTGSAVDVKIEQFWKHTGGTLSNVGDTVGAAASCKKLAKAARKAKALASRQFKQCDSQAAAWSEEVAVPRPRWCDAESDGEGLAGDHELVAMAGEVGWEVELGGKPTATAKRSRRQRAAASASAATGALHLETRAGHRQPADQGSTAPTKKLAETEVDALKGGGATEAVGTSGTFAVHLDAGALLAVIGRLEDCVRAHVGDPDMVDFVALVRRRLVAARSAHGAMARGSRSQLAA
jgi:hypothetical protein